MVHHLVEIQSGLRVLDENTFNEILRLIGNIFPSMRIEAPLASLDLFEQLEVIFGVERHRSGQDDKRDNANTPVIDLLAVLNRV